MTRLIVVGFAVLVMSGQVAPGVTRAHQGVTVAGRVEVVAGTTHEPVASARVAVTRIGQPFSHDTWTDEGGLFVFPNLPPGRYVVTASKPPFLSSAFGAARPGLPGVAITLAAGERRDDVAITLRKGGAVSGTLRDGFGTRQPDIEVTLQRVMATAGRPWRRTLRSDDRGQYRFFGVPPGRYVISARPVLSGTDVNELTERQVDAALRWLEAGRPGIGPDATSMASLAVQPGRPGAMAPTFHPSAMSIADARVLDVAYGEELEAVDVDLRPHVSPQLNVRVHGVNPESASLMLLSSPTGGGPPKTATVNADGTMTFGRVTPGRHILSGRWMRADRLTEVVRGTTGSPIDDGESCEVAAEEVVVPNADEAVVDLYPGPCFQITLSARLLPGVSWPAGSRVRVELVPLSSALGQTVTTWLHAPADHIVAVPRGVALPGTYVLRAAVQDGGSPTWGVAQAATTVGDLIDGPVRLDGSSGDIRIEVGLTDRLAALRGLFESASGTTSSDHSIVVFPTDASLWATPHRRIRTSRPDSNGTFDLARLPPGEYHVAAVTDLDPIELSEEAFLRDLVGAALTVTLLPGEVRTQSVRLVR